VHLETGADGERLLLAWLQQTRPFDAGQLRTHFFARRDEAAALHLMRIAAGLDSQVLGEPQILGQVTDAFEAGVQAGSIGPHLTTLFQAAIRTGKRARTETAVSRHPASISSVAVSQVEAFNGTLTDQRILVIGAGEMAELAVNALRKRGATQLMLANRSYGRARSLLGEGSGEVYRLDQLFEALVAADAVISATGAPHLVLTHELTESVMQARAGRPLLLVDIAVPRDIEPAAGDLPGVTLINLDVLHDSLEAAFKARAGETPRVELIIQQEPAAWKLAPHYSSLSIAKYHQKIADGLEMYRGHIDFEYIDSYHDAPGLIEALAERVLQGVAEWPAGERGDVHVILSAHSLPARILKANDPYDRQLRETARLVAERAGLKPEQWSWSYQSAGRSPEPWLGPQLDEHLAALAEQGVRKVVSVPIGFVCDHVEILYDIDIRARQVAEELGMRLVRPPALNTDPLFIQQLAELIEGRLIQMESNGKDNA
jgi:glutamyl-tRNA reductase